MMKAVAEGSTSCSGRTKINQSRQGWLPGGGDAQTSSCQNNVHGQGRWRVIGQEDTDSIPGRGSSIHRDTGMQECGCLEW